MHHTHEHIIKHMIGLQNLAEELGNFSEACQVMGLSRDTFYRYKQAVVQGGIESLLNKSRRRANPKNQVDE
jgi:ACT domain-containing protein